MTCPRCHEGSILSGGPKGRIEPGLLGDTYLSPAPAEAASAPTKKAIIVLTDIFGLGIPNPKLIADELASRLKCDVWVPDFFLGKPPVPADAMEISDRAGVKVTWWTWLKFSLTVALPNIIGHISNRPSRVDPRLEGFIQQLKEKNYEKIGAVGYCFGGSMCIRFGGKADLLNSIVICHPNSFTIEEVRNIKVPNAWACAEDDIFFANSLRDQSEAEFASRKDKENFVEYEFRVHKGTAHGFAIRPNMALPEIQEGFESALEQTVEWLKKTL